MFKPIFMPWSGDFDPAATLYAYKGRRHLSFNQAAMLFYGLILETRYEILYDEERKYLALSPTDLPKSRGKGIVKLCTVKNCGVISFSPIAKQLNLMNLPPKTRFKLLRVDGMLAIDLSSVRVNDPKYLIMEEEQWNEK